MRTLIAIPCMDEIDVEFVQCLMDLKRVGDAEVKFLSGSLVYEAREMLAAYAVEKEFDYVLWLDSDTVFHETLMLDFVSSDRDMISGVIPARRPPYPSLCYKAVDNKLVPITEYEERVMPIDGCGFGAVLMKTKILKESFDRFQTCFQPVKGFGEDLSFCLRARELGYQIFCDPRIEIGHIGKKIFRRQDARTD